MLKPRLMFVGGWWRVSAHPKSYRKRNRVERELWNAAYIHIDKLNDNDFYRDMREMFYGRLSELHKPPSQRLTEQWLGRPDSAYD